MVSNYIIAKLQLSEDVSLMAMIDNIRNYLLEKETNNNNLNI